jgi:hypothetical protein
MCFSAGASLAASAVLLGVGVLTIRSARGPRELPFAAMPLIFAVQQLIEGALWLTFDQDFSTLRTELTLAYVFFSHVFWPIYVPLAVMLMEPPSWRRRSLMLLATVGTAVSAFLLERTLAHGVTAQPARGHIEYGVSLSFVVPSALLYLLATSVSLLLSSHRTVRQFGVLTLLAFLVTYAFYATWLVSVWCYFAALLSGVVLMHFKIRPAASRAAPATG